MRVALLTPDLDPSYGWARHALELARALREQGVRVVALTQSGSRPPIEAVLDDIRPALPRLVPPSRGFILRSLAALSRVRRAVSDGELLHVIAEPYSLVAALAAGQRPLVVTAHGTYVPQTARRRIVGRLYRQVYRRAHLIAVSRYTAAQVQATLPEADLTVIPNGVHFARFQVPAPAPAKAGPTVLAAGGVKVRKGTHVLVAALARVRERVPEAQLVVTGRQDNPAYLAQVKRQIAELGLESAVHLVGQIPEPDLLGWYQHADVFALPSLTVSGSFEGFGLVVLEASASGLPVIGTTGSGVEEAVIEGQTGLLVPQDNAPALADAIIRLLTDAPLRQRMGAVGRDYARTQDWAVVAGRVIALYRQLLA